MAIPVIMGMLRAGLASALRIGAATAARGAVGAGLRRGAMQAAAIARNPTVQAASVQQGSLASSAATQSAQSTLGADALASQGMRSSAFNAAKTVYHANAERIRHITHSQVVNNNQQHHSNTDNSINDSYNQSADYSGQEGQQDGGSQPGPSNNSQARVAEDSPRLLASFETTLAIATLGLSALATGTIHTINALHRWGEGLSEQQRYLAQYNGTIAYSFAELEARRIGRNIRRADIGSGTTKYLNTELNKLEDKLLPYQTAATATMLILAGDILSALNSILELAEGVGGTVKKWLPSSWQTAVDVAIAAFRANPQQFGQNLGAIDEAIKVANQQPRRRATPPGGF